MKYTLLLLLILPVVDALSIDSVLKSPTTTAPGGIFSLTLSVVNEGSTDIEDILVQLQLENTPFAPLESSTRFIDEIRKDRSKTITYQLQVLPEATPGVYRLPIILHGDETIETITSIHVTGEAALSVGAEGQAIFVLGELGSLFLQFVNVGDGDLKFVSASIPELTGYRVLSQESSYIGNIQPDDFETIEVMLQFHDVVEAVPVSVQYKDVFNSPYNQVIPVSVQVISEEEAFLLGIRERNYRTVYISVVIILFILYLIIRRLRK